MNSLIIRLFLLLILFVSLNRVLAQEKEICVIVELSSGKQIGYRLVDHPRLVFNGKNIKLTSDKVSVEFVPSELVRLMIGELEIASTEIAEETLWQNDIKLKADNIHLNGFDEGDVVSIYSVSGIHLMIYHVEATGSLIIPFASLPKGISVINTPQQSIKVIKR